MNIERLGKIEQVSMTCYNNIGKCYEGTCNGCAFRINRRCKLEELFTLSKEVSTIAYNEIFSKKFVIIDETKYEVINGKLTYNVVFGPATSSECCKYKDDNCPTTSKIIEV